MGKKKHSLLWKIEGNDIMPSYLFGTMHVKDDRAFVHIQKAKKAIIDCEAFATEVDLSIGLEQFNPADMMLPEGSKVQDYYTPHHWKRMRRIVKKTFSVDLNAHNRLLPLLIVNQLTERMLDEQQSVPLDKALSLFADKNDKALMGLEYLYEQVATLKKIPIKFQLRSLSKFCRSISTHRKNLSILTSAYKSEDIHKLYKLTKKSLNGLKDVMLYKRNRIMADRFINAAMDRSLFAAVGAAHLSGVKGILRLIKEEGYNVKPIK